MEKFENCDFRGGCVFFFFSELQVPLSSWASGAHGDPMVRTGVLRPRGQGSSVVIGFHRKKTPGPRFTPPPWLVLHKNTYICIIIYNIYIYKSWWAVWGFAVLWEVGDVVSFGDMVIIWFLNMFLNIPGSKSYIDMCVHHSQYVYIYLYFFVLISVFFQYV